MHRDAAGDREIAARAARRAAHRDARAFAEQHRPVDREVGLELRADQRDQRVARELQIGGERPLVKLEVLADQKTLLPDGEETLRAAKQLVAEGFTVLPYCSDDPVLCRKLEEAGCAAVMPLGAPIGSGLGLRNPYSLQMILDQAKVPVIVDAGVGTASDCAVCMEMGVAGLLVNTAISGAQDPVAMATAMKLATEAGRLAFRAGRIPRKLYGSASSPVTGIVGK